MKTMPASCVALFVLLGTALSIAETPNVNNVPLKSRYIDAGANVPQGGQKKQKVSSIWVVNVPLGEPRRPSYADFDLGITYRKNPDDKQTVFLDLQWRRHKHDSNQIWFAKTQDTDVPAVNPIVLNYKKYELPTSILVEMGKVVVFWSGEKENFYIVVKFYPSMFPDISKTRVSPTMLASINKKASYFLRTKKPMPFNSLQARCMGYWPSTPELEAEYYAKWVQTPEAKKEMAKASSLASRRW